MSFSWCVCASSSQIASLNLMSVPVGCRPQHDDAPVTRSLSEESNVAAAIFPERSRRSRSDTSTSRKNIKFGGVGACRSDSSTRVSEASETRDTTRRTGVSLPPDGSRRRLRQVELALYVGQVSRGVGATGCATLRLVLYGPLTRRYTRVSGRDESRRVWTLLDLAHLCGEAPYAGWRWASLFSSVKLAFRVRSQGTRRLKTWQKNEKQLCGYEGWC